MTDLTSNEMETENKYGSIKVLTSLTFIGSGIGYIFGILGFINADKSVTDMETAMNNPDLPDLAKKMMTPEALENVRLMATNKLPILILGLVGTTLCLAGAIQMRKLKMQGYYLWLIGEILPVIGTLIFIGIGVFSGMTGIFSIAIMVLFIILYTSQRKYLINK